jgi:hypothetical protein
MTVYKALTSSRRGSNSKLINILLRDGASAELIAESPADVTVVCRSVLLWVCVFLSGRRVYAVMLLMRLWFVQSHGARESVDHPVIFSAHIILRICCRHC